MNVGYKHTPYNYKFCNCSWTVLYYQKVHFFFKSTAQQNFLATGLHTTLYLWLVELIIAITLVHGTDMLAKQKIVNYNQTHLK